MIGWATRRPAVVWAASAALICAGVLAFLRLPLATRTVVELPRLVVSSTWPGASAELLESYITSPLESAIQGVRDVRKISSESSDGDARLTVDLEPDADVQLTRLAILERIEILRKDFPQGASIPRVSNYVPQDLEEQPLLLYTVYGPYTAGTLAKLSADEIVPQLSAIEGVAGVNSGGGAERGISVTYDDQRLRQLGISPATLSQALSNARVVRSLGVERAGVSQRPVVLRDQPDVAADLAELPVTAPGGRIFRLGDLADVRLEEDSRDRFYRVNGEPAVSMEIARLPGADAIRTAARVRAAMTGIGRRLPPGIRVRLESDESVELRKQLNNLLLRGGIAFLSVLIVLALALRNVKSVGLVMGSAAVAIAGTALGLYLLKIPANLLTLAGLGMGVGILVQNGLVVVDRLRTAPDTPDGRAAAGRRIMPAVIGATLTTAVVLFPFLYLQGNARTEFVPFAVAFALALGWSVISALVMIPALGAGHGLRRGHWPKMSRIYGKSLVLLLKVRYPVLLIVAAGLGYLGWAFATKVPRSSFGNWFGQRTTLQAWLRFPRGSDPASLDVAMREFEQIVVGQPGVEQVVTQGSPSGASMRVVFTREEEFGPIPFEMQEALTQRAVLVGGASISVSGQGPGFYSGGGGGSSRFRIKVLGYSFGGVERMAFDIKRRLEQIPRVRDVNANAASFFGDEKAFTVTLDPDRAAMSRFGVTAADLAGAVSREVRGAVGRTMIELGGEEVGVSLKAAGARERTLEQLRDAIVPTSSESPARIRDLARVDEEEALSRINREDQQYVRIVSYEFRGPQKLANRTHDAFMESISVPPGYSVSDDVFAWETDESGKGLWLVFALGIILVLLSVAMVFDSSWASAAVFLSLPVALAGSAAAFWASGTAFSREAAVGVILVVGLAVNQAILVIDAALERRRRAKAEGGRPRVSGLGVVAACRDRAGMVVLVTLTTLASLLPLAIGADADELFGSIALATVGGTLAGTLGALFVVPLLVVSRRSRSREVERSSA